jgi:hypothetical protein
MMQDTRFFSCSLPLTMLYPEPCIPNFVISFFGDYSGKETPVPIPNTEVKLSSAHGTALVTEWESRTSPN